MQRFIFRNIFVNLLATIGLRDLGFVDGLLIASYGIDDLKQSKKIVCTQNTQQK